MAGESGDRLRSEEVAPVLDRRAQHSLAGLPDEQGQIERRADRHEVEAGPARPPPALWNTKLI